MPTPSLVQLKRAVVISEEIQKLEAELSSILKSSAGVAELVAKHTAGAPVSASSDDIAGKKGRRGKAKGKRIISAAHREAIAAAQRRRWSKVAKSKGGSDASPKKKSAGISAEGRARIAEAQKRRWAAFSKKKGD